MEPFTDSCIPFQNSLEKIEQNVAMLKAELRKDMSELILKFYELAKKHKEKGEKPKEEEDNLSESASMNAEMEKARLLQSQDEGTPTTIKSTNTPNDDKDKDRKSGLGESEEMGNFGEIFGSDDPNFRQVETSAGSPQSEEERSYHSESEARSDQSEAEDIAQNSEASEYSESEANVIDNERRNVSKAEQSDNSVEATATARMSRQKEVASQVKRTKPTSDLKVWPATMRRANVKSTWKWKGANTREEMLQGASSNERARIIPTKVENLPVVIEPDVEQGGSFGTIRRWLLCVSRSVSWVVFIVTAALLGTMDGTKASVSPSKWRVTLLGTGTTFASIPQRQDVCNTLVWNERASHLKDCMDPRDSFNSFSCGDWWKNHLLPPCVGHVTTTEPRLAGRKRRLGVGFKDLPRPPYLPWLDTVPLNKAEPNSGSNVFTDLQIFCNNLIACPKDALTLVSANLSFITNMPDVCITDEDMARLIPDIKAMYWTKDAVLRETDGCQKSSLRVTCLDCVCVIVCLSLVITGGPMCPGRCRKWTKVKMRRNYDGHCNDSYARIIK